MKNALLQAGMALTLPIFLIACDDDTDPNPPEQMPGDITEVAGEAGFNTLLSAATTAGLASALQGEGPFTVFAPTDEAFAALGDAAPSNPDLLANVLLHHVVSGSLDSAAVTSGSAITTLANTALSVDAASAPITVNGFNLSSTLDVKASNGIIHVMDQVIVPPTILETAQNTEDLSTLVTAVGASSQSIQDTLAAAGPLTIFAPVNSAFSKIPSESLTALLADQEALDNVLAYHVAQGQTLDSDLSDGQSITMANGDSLTVNIGSQGASITDAQGNTINIIATNIRLLNGVVHLIDTVLAPAPEAAGNVVEVATENGNFQTLLSAAQTADLVETMTGEGPFTVFAPTDAAFQSLGVDLSPVSADVVSNILLHHVISASLDSAAVVSGGPITTLANTTLNVDASGAPITINGFNLSETLDVQASNGVIHVMDQVIVPPTIIEVAQATPDLSVLVTAIGAASATVQGAVAPNTLSGESPITVFAPTNDAFIASGIDLGTVDQMTLDGVLAHHVAGVQALSTQLVDGQTVETLNGSLTISIDSAGAISITDGQGNTANVIATLNDIRTLTGVVHVIDAVLLP